MKGLTIYLTSLWKYDVKVWAWVAYHNDGVEDWFLHSASSKVECLDDAEAAIIGCLDSFSWWEKAKKETWSRFEKSKVRVVSDLSDIWSEVRQRSSTKFTSKVVSPESNWRAHKLAEYKLDNISGGWLKRWYERKFQ